MTKGYGPANTKSPKCMDSIHKSTKWSESVHNGLILREHLGKKLAVLYGNEKKL